MRLRGRWFGLWLLLGCFAVYLPTTIHKIGSLDVWSANYLSWRIATTGNPWIDGLNIPRLDSDPMRYVWMMHAANGHTVITRAPGVVAISLPSYFLLRPEHMTVFPGSMTAAALTAGAVLMMFLAMSTRLRRSHALLSALAYGFCTPVWSVSASGVWPQTLTGFGVAGMAWACMTRRWWWVGVFGGIALWARPHAALIAAIVGLYLAWRRREPGIAVRVGVASTAFLAGLCLWTHWIYGTWNPTGSYDGVRLMQHAERSYLSPVNQLGMWIAPDRGILVWSPVVALLIPALTRSWRSLPDWSRALLVGGLVYTIVQAAVNPFTGGDVFYGYRYGLEFLACSTPSLAMSVPRVGRVARALLGPVLAVQLLAFALGAASYDLWLPIDQAWRSNAFVHGVDMVGPAGWLVVVLVAALGVLASRIVVGRTTRPEATLPARQQDPASVS